MLVARVEKLLMVSKWLWVVPSTLGYQFNTGQILRRYSFPSPAKSTFSHKKS